MSQKRLLTVGTIIALVVLVGFVLSVPHTRDVGKVASPGDVVAVPTVTLHDSFKKGTHTITGSVNAPNACTTVTATASLLGNASSTTGILVSLSLPKDSGVCLQLPTPAAFSVSVSAPALLPISATVNGVVASTTVS